MTWVCGWAAVIMVAAAVALFVLARTYQIDQLDTRVREKARLIVSMIEFEGDSLSFEFEELDMRDFETRAAGWYLEVWLGRESVYRSGSLGSAKLDVRAVGDGGAGLSWVTLPGPTRGRGMMRMFDLPAAFGGGEQDDSVVAVSMDEASLPMAVFIARDAADMLGAMRYLAIGLAAVTAVAILLMAAAAGAVVHRSMKPVDVLAGRIEAIDASDLDDQVEVAALPRELTPVVSQFNALMARLQSAFEREKGFCADVAHELRTPLAGLRTTLDVAGSRQRSADEYAKAIEACRDVVMQTQHLVDYLLQIGRLETGQVTLDPQPVDVDQLLGELWRQLADKSEPSKRFELVWDLSAGQTVRTDPAVLAIVLRNLLHNAIEYVDEGGEIRIATASEGDGLKITIANTGCQVGGGDVEKVFDRFWRGSASRSGTGSHFGLGLSLAQRAMVSLGGKLKVEAELNGMFQAVCVLGAA